MLMAGGEKWKPKQQQIGRKKRYQWPASVVSYYICNLPEGCTRQRLRKECYQFGRVVDVFVSDKKSRNGDTYGFVKFDDVKDKLMLERVLGKIKIGNRVLVANIERYDRDHKEVKQPSAESLGEKGTGEQHSVWGRLNWQTKGGIRDSGGSYADVLRKGFVPAKEEKKVDIGHHVPNYIDEWSSISLIGKTIDADTLDNLILVLNTEDVPIPQLRFMGGLNVLMTFHDEDEAVVFFEGMRNRKDIFDKLEHWKSQVWKQERVITLKIYGIPPPLWGDEVFDKVGNMFGVVVRRTGADGYDANLAFKKVRILTSSFDPIDEVCSVHWGKSIFSCRVKEADEEWLPDFVRHQDGIAGRAASPVTPSVRSVVVRNGNGDSVKSLGNVAFEEGSEKKSTAMKTPNSPPEKLLSLVSGEDRTVCRIREDQTQEVNEVGSPEVVGPVKDASPKPLQEMLIKIGLGPSHSEGSNYSRNGYVLKGNKTSIQLVSSGPVLRSRSKLGNSVSIQTPATSTARDGKRGKRKPTGRNRESSKEPDTQAKVLDPVELENEVQETIQIGKCVGVALEADEGKVAEVVVGDNYTCV
ncbi:hypothetical protein SSX86_023358 [Deinandra increscens subsp. villosa]|uniref:RRM domain-containing protein n=1 Tax=Deinandra increscens subsp. villosa TaxID=3103831 RepID=A0AAP0GR56_9ASTR